MAENLSLTIPSSLVGFTNEPYIYTVQENTLNTPVYSELRLELATVNEGDVVNINGVAFNAVTGVPQKYNDFNTFSGVGSNETSVDSLIAAFKRNYLINSRYRFTKTAIPATDDYYLTLVAKEYGVGINYLLPAGITATNTPPTTEIFETDNSLNFKVGLRVYNTEQKYGDLTAAITGEPIVTLEKSWGVTDNVKFDLAQIAKNYAREAQAPPFLNLPYLVVDGLISLAVEVYAKYNYSLPITNEVVTSQNRWYLQGELKNGKTYSDFTTFPVEWLSYNPKVELAVDRDDSYLQPYWVQFFYKKITTNPVTLLKRFTIYYEDYTQEVVDINFLTNHNSDYYDGVTGIIMMRYSDFAAIETASTKRILYFYCKVIEIDEVTLVEKQITKDRRFNLREACSERTLVIFRNSLNGFESYTFTNNQNTTISRSSDRYEKAMKYDYTSYDHQIRETNLEAIRSISLYTDYLDKESYEFMEEMILSRDIYKIEGSESIGRSYFPLVLSSSDYNLERYVYHKGLNLTFDYSQKIKTL